jgi:hypothetical protein
MRRGGVQGDSESCKGWKMAQKRKKHDGRDGGQRVAWHQLTGHLPLGRRATGQRRKQTNPKPNVRACVCARDLFVGVCVCVWQQRERGGEEEEGGL